MAATTAKAKTAQAEKKTEKKTANTTTPENFIENVWNVGKAQDHFAKASASLEDVAAFQRETAEALAETATLAQKSFEAITAESVTFSQKSFEDGVAVAKKALASTSVQEAVELQTEFAKTAVEAYLGHIKKIGEMFQVSAQEVAAPMNTRVTAIVETAQKAAL